MRRKHFVAGDRFGPDPELVDLRQTDRETDDTYAQ
jgi:hypothetical protein